METLRAHYGRLLGLDEAWRVEAVDLRLEERRLEIRVTHVGGPVACPGAGASADSPTMPRSGAGGIWTRCSSPPR